MEGTSASGLATDSRVNYIIQILALLQFMPGSCDRLGGRFGNGIVARIISEHFASLDGAASLWIVAAS